MKKIYLIITSIVLLIIDTSFANLISIKGIYPSFLFVFAIAYSIINGEKEAMFIGILSGLLQDIYFFQGFGVNTLVNMWLCVLAGVIGSGIWREKRLIPLVTIFSASILKYFGIYIILSIFSVKVYLHGCILYAIYNSIVMILIYSLVYNVCNTKDKNFSWRFREK